MSFQKDQEKIDAKDASSVYVETEQPAGGFATDVGEAVKEQSDTAGTIDLSMLPQNKEQCLGHTMWKLSKKCVVCKKTEFSGAVTSNQSLFNHHGCNFIRACQDHHSAVSAHFAKPEFSGPFNGLETRWCSGCRKPFVVEPDSQNGFCNKGCQGNWLYSRFG